MLLRVLVASLMVVAASCQSVVINLPQGKIEGTKETIDGARHYIAFRGIPFAEPPVGELRLKAPVPAKPWDGQRQPFEPPSCTQFGIAAFFTGEIETEGNEDCLYLHVYKPAEGAQNLPVMVYIHGGGFVHGASDAFGGSPKFLLKKDVILVSIQYRLGTLGFLSTGDSVLPGNLGLKDQTLALKWVHDNIHLFGGDPERITIFGGSAGSASVHYQVLTPYAKGLFSRGIMQSGTSLCPWAMRDDHAEMAAKIAKDLKCAGADEASSPAFSEQLLKCLQAASVEDLVLATAPYKKFNMPFFMVPRVDGDYLPASPAQLLTEGNYNKVDLIAGVCQNEGATSIMMMLTNDTMKTMFEEDFSNIAPFFFGMEDEENNQYLYHRMLFQYVQELSVTEENAAALEKLFTDSSMSICNDEAIALHERDARYGKQIYRYELQHRPSSSFSDMFNTSVGKNWVSNVDDLSFLFNDLSGIATINGTDDLFLSDIMVTLWTNFAETGNPTPDLELGFKWNPMQSETDFSFLSLTPSPRMKEDNREEIREFWRNMPYKDNKILFPERFKSDIEQCRR